MSKQGSTEAVAATVLHGRWIWREHSARACRAVMLANSLEYAETSGPGGKTKAREHTNLAMLSTLDRRQRIKGEI